MYFVLIAIILILALLLVGLVLLQPGKQSGLQGMANTGATQQLLGTRQSADVLVKTTWGVVALIVVLSIASTYTLTANKIDVIKPKGSATPAAAPAPTQKAPASAPTQKP